MFTLIYPGEWQEGKQVIKSKKGILTMRIRWERIVGILSLVTFVYLLFKLRPFLRNILSVVNEDDSYHKPMKAIMLGVLCLTFLCGIKLLTRKQETEK